MPSSIKIDQIAFLAGGYGAVGVSMYTLRVYKGVPLPPSVESLNGNENFEEWKRKLKHWTKFAFCLGLVQLRAIERFFIGGCLYISIGKILVAYGRTNPIINAAIAGSIVGTYECGYYGTLRNRINSMTGAAGFAILEEAIVLILQKKSVLLQRPTSVVIMNYDPLLYIVGAFGAYVIGLYTLTFFEEIRFPHLPQNENEPFSTVLKNWLTFSGKFLTSAARIEMRIEERSFLGGCISWAVENLFRKIGVDNRWLRVTVTGGIVGAYFGTYGGEEKILPSAAGIAVLGIIAELLVAPVLSREQLWEFMLPFPEILLEVQDNIGT